MNTDIILEKHSNNKFSKYILAMDIGGTVTQIGLIGIKSKTPYLAYSSEVWTQKIKSPYKFIRDILDFAKEQLNITIKKASIAIAGPLNTNGFKAELTHGNLKMNINELKKKIGVEKAILLNDFEALGYAINLFSKNTKTTKPLAIIGAGTGLGKTLLVHNGKYYEPYPSEGGRAEFPIRTEKELKLAMSITKGKRILKQEDIVSGKGLENIYNFLRSTKKIKPSQFTKEIDESKNKSFEITKHKKQDKTCKETFKEFSKYYARIVKNFLLETLPYGGIYIAGGIVARNPELIGKEFFKELLSNLTKTQTEIIKNIPIKVIKQKETSLLGCTFAILNK